MLSDQGEVRKNTWLAWVMLSVGLIATIVVAFYVKKDVEAVLSGGTIISLLLFWLLLFLSNTRFRAHQMVEEALRESEARLSVITDSAQDAILMMDTQGIISYWNPAAERILGYKSTEAIGRNLHTFIVPSRYYGAHQAAFPVFQQTGQGGAVGKTIDLEARRKDNTEISVQLSLSAVRVSGGWHAVGILRDITDRKRADAELQEINIHLKEAIARAEMASAAKSEFLANMSHEIRTPMNGVIGMIGLLMDTELDDEQRRYAEIVRTSGESLLGVINDILDFSKIEAKKLDLEMLDFDLSSLLDDLADSLALRAHEKGLELLCAADLKVPTLLRGDPGRLRQILTNMAGNAIKFTSAGDVIVRVSLGNEMTESREQGAAGERETVLLRFSVCDTGIGIPDDKIGLIFDKFSQADASSTRQYGGTGLGLAISRQLAEMMGGEAGVNSEKGKGSEFWFTARFDKQAGGVHSESILPADLRGVRVLIVDDNATNREILTIRLTSWGMRPSEVQDGYGAIKALCMAIEENDPFRIAVIDMQMPGMDGETLGRIIKADHRMAGIRMVMLTSMGTRGDARRFHDIGFAAYTNKPIRHHELKAMLSMALAEHGGTEPEAQFIATRHTARETMDLFAGRKARILLAEDNIINQQVTLGILKKLGLHADAVTNGAEAVKALEIIHYDLVLMDVQMPVMDGLEATRRIRNNEKIIMNYEVGIMKEKEPEKLAAYSSIPIIAMTAHAMQGDRERFLKAGMNDYVAKPVDPAQLAEVLDLWLKDETGKFKPETGAEKEDLMPGARLPAPSFEYQNSTIFDRADMMTRLLGDEDLAQKVIGKVLVEMPKQLMLMKEYVEQGQAKRAGVQAHKIRGAAGNIGSPALQEIAHAMEQAGNAEEINLLRTLMPEMEKQFELLKEAMEASEP